MSSVDPTPPLSQPQPHPPPHLTHPRNQALLTQLLRCPLCAPCILRYCNVRDTDAYTTAPLAVLYSWITSQQAAWTPPPLCFACLNILPSLPSNVDTLLTSSTYTSYTFTTFALTVSLPITATLRHLSFVASLSPPSPSPTSPTPAPLPCLDLKEAIKSIVLSHISSHTSHLPLPSSPPADLSLNLTFTHPSTPSEATLISSHTPSHLQPHSHKRHRTDDALLTQAHLLQILPSITQPELVALYATYHTAAEEGTTPKLSVEGEEGGGCGFEWALVRPAVLLMGNYIKHSRAISQTPWSIDSDDDPPPPPLPSPSSPSSSPPPPPFPNPPAPTARVQQRITSTSVQEELSRHILPAFSATFARFSSSGREDLDVRMLGEGRPFVLEMQGVRRVLEEAEVRALEALVNRREEEGEQLVEVRGLRLVGKREFEAMKAEVESKRKRYRCVVWVGRAVTGEEVRRLGEVRELVVQQKTPIRVLHRRTALVRAKVVHEVEVQQMAPQWLRVDLLTSAGAYVKEFVHGDRGRTQPSLASMLGCACDCVQLDVLQLIHD